jgi:hypothetical protein
LKKIFSNPVVVSVEGEWKTGKTDFALYIAEKLLQYKIVDEVATNIFTTGDNRFSYICDLQNLKFWLHRNTLTKLYILDELNVNAPSRRAMSNKSVGIISILPECSKGRARVIGLAQDLEGVDSEFKKDVWVKARFTKLITEDSRVKTVRVFSTLLRQIYVLNDVPKTLITFDPYLIAPFTLKPEGNVAFPQDESLAKLSEWAHGKPWKELFQHPQECNRFVRAQVLNLLNLYSQFTPNSRGGTTEQSSELKDQ